MDPSSNMSSNLVGGSEFLDQFGRSWVLLSDSNMTISSTSFSQVFPMTSTDPFTVQNAYESVVDWNISSQACPQGATVCCLDAKGVPKIRQLIRDGPLYSVSVASSPSFLQGSVSFQCGGNSCGTTVWRAVAFLPGYSLLNSSWALLCAPYQPCFFVPRAVVSANSSNSIGISDSTYKNADGLCFSDANNVVAIPGSSRYDQMYVYRNNTLPDVFSDKCTGSTLGPNYASFSCPVAITFVAAQTVALAPFFGVPRIAIAVFVLDATMLSGVISVRVANVGTKSTLFKVSVVDCSYQTKTQMDIQAPYQQEVNVNGTADFFFNVAGVSLLNSSSFCFVTVEAYGIQQVSGTAFVGSALSRRATCTIDQTLPSCSPQDCFTKYNGEKNFYNPQTGLCEATTVCSSTQIYNPASNTCSSPDQVSSYLQPVTTPPSDAYQSFNVSSVTINCPHGTVTSSPSGVTCVCNAGWSTDFNQPFYSFVYCSVSSNTTSSSASSVSGSQGSATLVNPFVIIVTLLSLSVASCIGCCIGCCVCKARKRARKRQKLQDQYDQMAAGLYKSWRVQPTTVHGLSGLPENSLNFETK